MFRGRAAFRFFGVDSLVNDAGSCPRKWILARISRADKGNNPSLSPFLRVIRYPALVANENLAGWPLPVRALRKGLTRAFNQRRARANASHSRSATGQPDFSRPLCTRDHDKSAASRRCENTIATTAYSGGSSGFEYLFLARYRRCDFARRQHSCKAQTIESCSGHPMMAVII